MSTYLQDTHALIVVAEVTAKPGQADALRRELTAMLAPSRAEPGCVSYVLHELDSRPGQFLFHEVWSSEAAFAFHEGTKHYRDLGPKIKDLLEGQPVLRKFRVVG